MYFVVDLRLRLVEVFFRNTGEIDIDCDRKGRKDISARCLSIGHLTNFPDSVDPRWLLNTENSLL